MCLYGTMQRTGIPSLAYSSVLYQVFLGMVGFRCTLMQTIDNVVAKDEGILKWNVLFVCMFIQKTRAVFISIELNCIYSFKFCKFSLAIYYWRAFFHYSHLWHKQKILIKNISTSFIILIHQGLIRIVRKNLFICTKKSHLFPLCKK